jgi:hypothetical protein
MEPEKTPPAQALGTPSPGVATFRATNFRCLPEEGHFVLSIYDKRQPQPVPLGQDFGVRAWFEVIKLDLSPIAIQYLAETLQSAIQLHEKIHGKMMTPQGFQKSVADFIARQGIQAAQNLLKPPDESPNQ